MKYWGVLLLFLLAGSSPALAQRCGDHVWINLRDAKGQVIKPEDFDSVKFTRFDSYSTQGKVEESKAELVDIPPGVKSYSVRTVCGMEWMEFRFVYHRETMLLRIRNIPGDGGNLLLNGFSFRKGSYEVDFGKKINDWEPDKTIKVPYPYSPEFFYLLKQEKFKPVKDHPANSKR